MNKFIKLITILSLPLLIFGCSGLFKDGSTLTLELNPGVDTIEVNSSFNDSGAIATLEGDLYQKVNVIESTVDISKVGEYYIIYQVSFGNNTLTQTRYVNVIDSTPPQITLNPGIDTILVHQPWTDAYVDVIDNSLLEVDVVTYGHVNTSQIGEYEITYVATDAYGNQSSITRYVFVIR